MGFKFNPLGFSGFDLVAGGGNQLFALTGNVAPNLGLGVPATVGQLYTNQTDNSLWLKFDLGNTDWVLESTPGSDITSLNGLTDSAQTFSTSETGTDFTITSALGVHTFNLPIASALNTGKLSSADFNTFNAKLDSNSVIDGGTWV